LVTAREEATGGRKAKIYTITDAGLAALDDWLADDPVPRPPRNELLLKMFFGYRQDPGILTGWLQDKIAESDADLARFAKTRAKLEDIVSEVPDASFWLMTLDYGERRALFEKDWARACRERFKDPSPQGDA